VILILLLQTSQEAEVFCVFFKGSYDEGAPQQLREDFLLFNPFELYDQPALNGVVSSMRARDKSTKENVFLANLVLRRKGRCLKQISSTFG